MAALSGSSMDGSDAGPFITEGRTLKMKYKRVLSALLAVAMGVSMAACGGSSESGSTSASSAASTSQEASAPGVGGTLTVGLNANPVSSNIWVQNDLNSSVIMNLVCPNLVTMDETGNKYGYLAEATSNEDCTQWTITLKDLYWNDGTPVTAEDVAFSTTYGVEHQIGFFDSCYGHVASTEVVDDKTVVFNLESADVNFFNGGFYWIPIMRKSEFESVTDPLNYIYSGAGYGPYYVDEWVDGQYVSLKRNPYFTQANDGQGAYLDNILFRVYTDENAMVLALENGEIDVCANYISANSQTQLAANEKYLLTTVDGLGYGQLSYSQTNALLQDVNMRQAISMCIDREALVAVGMNGEATAMYTPISPVYQDFVASNIQQPAFDTAAAKSLLESNGYADTDGDGILESADGTKASFTVSYKTSIQNVDNVMEILRTGAAQAGIELKLEPLDASTYSAKVTNGQTFDISYSIWGTIDDVDTTLYTCYGIGQTLNFMQYNNEEMDNLLIAMKSEPDRAKRIEMLDQWQQLWVDNMPSAMTYVPKQTYVANTEKFAGFSAVLGNCGYLNCAQAIGIYAK